MMLQRSLLLPIILFAVLAVAFAFQPSQRLAIRRRVPLISRFLMTTEQEKISAEQLTEKYGLEVGLAQAAKNRDEESAKSLLKKYGIAYLATSIPLAMVSFAICYVLVDNGIDVGTLLSKVGIENHSVADKAGTFAIAYAAHKAASPIRFPPTVLLTPIVAKMIGKEPEAFVTNDDDSED
jgi:hypothetical protein